MADVTVHVLRQLDVAGFIDLDELRQLAKHGPLPAGARLAPGEPDAPGVVLSRRPLDIILDDVAIGPLRTAMRLRVFDFGVVALRFTFSRSGLSPADLVRLAGEIAEQGGAIDLEAHRLWAALEASLKPALTPDELALGTALMEDFVVFVLSEPLPGEEGDEAIVRTLLTETGPRRLAPDLVRGFMDHAIRYYADDLVALSWDAAVIVESAGALDIVNVIEIASAQLLEVRYYAGIARRAGAALTEDALRSRGGWSLLRSPFGSLARRAALIALELGQMTDRLETAISLVGDSYLVKVYGEAARRFRLVESRRAVREQIDTLAGVAATFSDDVAGRRSLYLEVLIVVLIFIEVLKAW